MYSGAYRVILKHLKYFREIDFATKIVSALIDQYSVIISCVGEDCEFTNFIKHYEIGSEELKNRNKARLSFEK